MNLTSAEIQEKIERVKVDLQLILSNGGDSRKFEALSEYKEMLEEDLAEAKRAGR
jgi:hypothetical protein